MTQAELWPSRIDARFAAFHKANPAVYRLFVAFAEQAQAAGRRRIGVKAIAERIRWEVAVNTAGESFKLNNVYVSRYARLLQEQRPDLGALIETRRLKS